MSETKLPAGGNLTDSTQNTDAVRFLRRIDELERAGKNSTMMGSDRQGDRLRQGLRRDGLCTYVKGQGWRITDKGRAILSRAQLQGKDGTR